MILPWLEILASLSRAPHTALPTPLEEGAVVAALQAPTGFTLEEMRDH